MLVFGLAINAQSIAQKAVEPLLEQLEKQLAPAKVPDAMISIVSGDSIIYAGGIGYAEIEQKERVTKDHLFRQASISKSFTALGVVKLFLEEELKLATPIEAVDKTLNFENPWKATSPITVEQVLEHTAGENDDGDPALWLANEYAEKGSILLRTAKNVGMGVSFLWTILFVIIGLVGILGQVFAKSNKSRWTRLLPWIAALSFVLMPLGLLLSSEVLDSPKTFNAGTILLFVSSISFFLFSMLSLWRSINLKEERLGFKIYYRFTALCLSFLAILLLLNNLIGFRLWSY